MPWKEALEEKIKRRDATICVFGLGHVGLPVALLFASKGFKVLGFDVSRDKISKLLKGEAIFPEDEELSSRTLSLIERGLFLPTSDPEKAVKQADFILICVPTPVDEHNVPDLSYVESASRTIASHLSGGKFVILESTSFPGTTEERSSSPSWRAPG